MFNSGAIPHQLTQNPERFQVHVKKHFLSYEI